MARKWLPCGFYDVLLLLIAPVLVGTSILKVIQSQEYIALVIAAIPFFAIIAHFIGHSAKYAKRL